MSQDIRRLINSDVEQKLRLARPVIVLPTRVAMISTTRLTP